MTKADQVHVHLAGLRCGAAFDPVGWTDRGCIVDALALGRACNA
jgi:hypothetical protein